MFLIKALVMKRKATYQVPQIVERTFDPKNFLMALILFGRSHDYLTTGVSLWKCKVFLIWQVPEKDNV